MFEYLKEHVKAFWAGFIAGGIPVGGVVFSTPPLLNAFWLSVVLKLVTTIIFAAASGMATILMTDIYKYHIKHKLFKDDKKRDEGKDSKEDSRTA